MFVPPDSSSQVTVLTATSSVKVALVKFMLLMETSCELISSMPWSFRFCKVPPLPSVMPLPVTVKSPLPVLLRVMPVSAPLELTLWRVMPLAPMVVLMRLTAVPDVELTEFVVPVTLTVPALFARNPVPPVVVILRALIVVLPVVF